jgi:predicted RecB family nuclease
MADPGVPAIYEAGFLHDSVRIRVDVLERPPDGKWNLIEVKSSTSAKDEHLPDVAVQYRVLQGLGLEVARAGILHLNNEYVYDGRRVDLEQFFIFSDLTREVIDHQAEVQANLSRLKEALAGRSPPTIEPGRHCSSPYRCEFWEHCTAGKSESWVMNLSGITQKKLNELAALDVEDIHDVPDDFTLTALQARIRECVAEGKEYVAPELADELRDVEFPIHFLDFETIGPAIPRYEGTRPYQTIPFQWSDHVLHEDGTMEHPEFLHNEDTDPREGFCRTLLETLGDTGTIVIYTTYEVGIMTSLADDLPRYAGRLMAALDRIKDLHALVKTYFYHPDFQGSFSLKKVLPALVPSMAYEGLAIQEGTLASLEYLRMLDPSARPEERKRIREDLLTYCGHDTLAMVKIREELLRRS